MLAQAAPETADLTDPFSSSGAKAPPKPFTATEGVRKVRSFVLRQGRVSSSQLRYHETMMDEIGVP